MIEYPRETLEYVPVTLRLNAVVQTSFEYAITLPWERPQTWTPVQSDAGVTAFLLDADTLGQGTYRVWVRKDGVSEDPVVIAGELRIT